MIKATRPIAATPRWNASPSGATPKNFVKGAPTTNFTTYPKILEILIGSRM